MSRARSHQEEEALNALDQVTQFPDLLELCQRAIDHNDCYLELHVAGLLIYVYPGRLDPTLLDRKARLTILAGFMLALAEEVETPPVRIALLQGESAVGGSTQIGLASASTDTFLDMIWLPADVIGVRPLDIPSVAFFDMSGNALIAPEPLRRIRL